jgi:Transposase DDE domain
LVHKAHVSTELVTGKCRSETVYGLTSLTAQKARPARLLSLNRNHWSIENRCHWIRDVTFDEDRCQIRTGAAAQVMAGLRNLVLSLLRMAGATIRRGWLRCVPSFGLVCGAVPSPTGKNNWPKPSAHLVSHVKDEKCSKLNGLSSFPG